MTEQTAGPKGPTLDFPIPMRTGSPTGGGPEGKPKTTDELYNGVMEALKKNVELVGAARASRIVGTTEEEGQSGKPETDGRSALRPFQELNEAAQLFGVNIGELMAQINAEKQALRDATDAKDREIHELRLKDLTQTEDRIRNIAKGFAEHRGGGGDLGTAMGLGELDPDVRRRIQERAFRLDGPPSGDGGEPKQPTPFTLEWFKQWGELEPSVQAVARMFGMIPKEEAGSNQQGMPMVTMEDVRSGNVPTDLLISLRKVESEAELEKIRIDKEDARENRRIDVFGQLSTTLKENLPDAWAAIRDVAAEHAEAAESEGARGTDRGVRSRLKGIRCGDCGYEFGVEEELERYTCPRCGVNLDASPEQPTLAERATPNADQVTQGEHGEELRV